MVDGSGSGAGGHHGARSPTGLSGWNRGVGLRADPSTSGGLHTASDRVRRVGSPTIMPSTPGRPAVLAGTGPQASTVGSLSENAVTTVIPAARKVTKDRAWASPCAICGSQLCAMGSQADPTVPVDSCRWILAMAKMPSRASGPRLHPAQAVAEPHLPLSAWRAQSASASKPGTARMMPITQAFARKATSTSHSSTIEPSSQSDLARPMRYCVRPLPRYVHAAFS